MVRVATNLIPAYMYLQSYTSKLSSSIGHLTQRCSVSSQCDAVLASIARSNWVLLIFCQKQEMEELACKTTAMASDADEIREAAAVGHERYGETQVVRKVDTVIDIQQEKSRQDMEAVR